MTSAVEGVASSDTAVAVALLVFFTAMVGAVGAWLRGVRQDTNSQAQAVMETAVEYLSKANKEFREQTVPKLEDDIRALHRARVHCENEKDKMRRELEAEIEALRVEVRELKRRFDA